MTRKESSSRAVVTGGSGNNSKERDFIQNDQVLRFKVGTEYGEDGCTESWSELCNLCCTLATRWRGSCIPEAE